MGVPGGGTTRLPAEWGCPPSYQRSLSIAHCSAPLLCIMHICWMCSSHLAPHTSRLAIPHPFCAPHCITNNFAQLPTTSITYCFPATTGFTGACSSLLTRLIDLRHRAAVWRRQLKRLPPVREASRSDNATQGCGPCATLEPPPTSSHCELEWRMAVAESEKRSGVRLGKVLPLRHAFESLSSATHTAACDRHQLPIQSLDRAPDRSWTSNR